MEKTAPLKAAPDYYFFAFVIFQCPRTSISGTTNSVQCSIRTRSIFNPTSSKLNSIQFNSIQSSIQTNPAAGQILGSVYALKVNLWCLSTLCRSIMVSVYALQVRFFWGLSTLYRSNVEVCLRSTGQIFGYCTLSRCEIFGPLYRLQVSLLGSVYALRVKFWGLSTICKSIFFGSVYALQVNFLGVSTLYGSIFLGLSTLQRPQERVEGQERCSPRTLSPGAIASAP